MKQTITSIAISVAVSVLLVWAFLSPPLKFGGTVHNFPEWFASGLKIGAVGGANGNSTLLQLNCATKAVTMGSVGGQATTSIPFSLVGVSTSSNSVYFFGNNTSSAGYDKLLPIAYIASSTANGINVILWNATTTAIAAANSSTTFSLCYLQF